MGWLERAMEFVRGAPHVPEALSAECLKKGYQLAREVASVGSGSIALATVVTRAGEIQHFVAPDGNPQAAQDWISAGIAAREYAQVHLYMTLRAENAEARGDRLLACYMDSPGRGPATLILRPLVFTNGIVTLGDMTAQVSDVRIAI